MNASIKNSITNNNMEVLLDLTYSNIKNINTLFNTYVAEFKNNAKDNLIDITTIYSNVLLLKCLKDFNETPMLCKEISLLRQIILNITELFVEHKVHVKDHFKNDDRHKTSYNLVVCDNSNKIKAFVLYLLVYRIESSIRSYSYKDKRRRAFVGIDYEFAKGEIALMQMNFENIKTKDTMINYMFIIDPTELNKIQMGLLIRKLMENKKIFKIFHGADSLDIPYTLNHMFENDSAVIKKFMKKFVDTRFLCEYFRGSLDNTKKCTIYEALNYFGTIDNKKLNYLIETHDSMGPIQNISWNIHKLTPFHRKYAFYDVIYLPKLFTDIYKMAYDKTPDLFEFYRYLNEITRFILKEKRGITFITDIKLHIDKFNNNILKINNKSFTLVTIFNDIVYDVRIDSIKLNLSLLLNINYFKSTLILLFKKITYSILTTDYDVYVNKKQKQKETIQLDDLYNDLQQYNYDKILTIVKLLYPEIKSKVSEYLHNKN